VVHKRILPQWCCRNASKIDPSSSIIYTGGGAYVTAAPLLFQPCGLKTILYPANRPQTKNCFNAAKVRDKVTSFRNAYRLRRLRTIYAKFRVGGNGLEIYPFLYKTVPSLTHRSTNINRTINSISLFIIQRLLFKPILLI
jgi:hypothetical protein